MTRYLLLLCISVMVLNAAIAAPKPPRSATAPDQLNDRLVGTWSISVLSPDIGFLQTRMTFAMEDGKLEGHSYDGGASLVASWLERTVAGATSSIFKNGALLHIMQLTPRSADSFAAAFSSAAGAVLMEGWVRGDSMNAHFKRKGSIVGWITGSRRLESITLTHYPTLVASALDTLRTYVYDPSLVTANAFEDFADELTTLGTDAREDAEMLMKFFRLRADLPFSHCYLYREAQSAKTVAHAQRATLDTTHPNANIITIATFSGNGDDIDSVMQIVHDQRGRKPRLIIDLRGNTGGNVSATRLAKHFVRERTVVGTFITRRFTGPRSEPFIATSGMLPDLETSNTDTLLRHLRTGPGVRLVVTPGSETYTGTVTILTDGRTASTCEPLVYAFRSRGLARVVGERTAGAMLSAEPFTLADGWRLVVPTADYFTHDGKHLDQVGVEPDVKTASEDALTQALQRK